MASLRKSKAPKIDYIEVRNQKSRDLRIIVVAHMGYIVCINIICVDIHEIIEFIRLIENA